MAGHHGGTRAKYWRRGLFSFALVIIVVYFFMVGCSWRPTGSVSGAGGKVAGSRTKTPEHPGPTTKNRSGTPAGIPNPTSFSTPDHGLSASPGCLPTALEIPSLGISDSIRALGLNAQGQVYPPQRTTMWYNGSAMPGQDGISVIAGHVTYDGPDNFYNLVNATARDRVMISCSGGRILKLQVNRTRSMPKTTLQTDQSVWGSSRVPVVVLITCDPRTPLVQGHHVNNFVVWTSGAH